MYNGCQICSQTLGCLGRCLFILTGAERRVLWQTKFSWVSGAGFLVTRFALTGPKIPQISDFLGEIKEKLTYK